MGYICRKSRYTRGQAESTAAALVAADHRSVEAYECPQGHWHVGHKPKRKRECRGCRLERAVKG